MHRRYLLKGAAFSAGLALAPRAFGQGSKPGRWLRIESPRFIVFSTASENDTRAEVVALERFHGLLARLMPRPEQATKLHIYIAGSSRDFDLIAPWADSDIGGFYDAGIEEVRAVTSTKTTGLERQRDMPRNVRALDARVVLFHEYAHHYLRANSRLTYPLWYSEGFAEFISTADFTDQGVFVGKFTSIRAQWIVNGDWLGIDRFLTNDPGEMSRDDNAQFYAQSWLATHFLFGKPERAEGFDRYIKALQEGGDPIGAFEPAFGVSPATFDKELRDYKKKSLSFSLIKGPPPDLSASLKVERLGVSVDNLLMPLGHLRGLPAPSEAAGSLKMIREEAQKHQGDAFAMAAQALAEVWYGDLGVARRKLDTLIALNSKNPEFHHLSGLCDLRAGYAAKDAALMKRARSAFATAHRLDGQRSGSLFRYVECDLSIEKTVTPHITDVLVTAYNTTPQLNILALVTAQALMEHKRWDEAFFVLRPLAAAAHGGDLARRAQELLAAAREHKPVAFEFWGSAETIEEDDE